MLSKCFPDIMKVSPSFYLKQLNNNFYFSWLALSSNFSLDCFCRQGHHGNPENLEYLKLNQSLFRETKWWNNQKLHWERRAFRQSWWVWNLRPCCFIYQENWRLLLQRVGISSKWLLQTNKRNALKKIKVLTLFRLSKLKNLNN